MARLRSRPVRLARKSLHNGSDRPPEARWPGCLSTRGQPATAFCDAPEFPQRASGAVVGRRMAQQRALTRLRASIGLR